MNTFRILIKEQEEKGITKAKEIHIHSYIKLVDEYYDLQKNTYPASKKIKELFEEFKTAVMTDNEEQKKIFEDAIRGLTKEVEEEIDRILSE